MKDSEKEASSASVVRDGVKCPVGQRQTAQRRAVIEGFPWMVAWTHARG